MSRLEYHNIEARLHGKSKNHPYTYRDLGDIFVLGQLEHILVLDQGVYHFPVALTQFGHVILIPAIHVLRPSLRGTHRGWLNRSGFTHFGDRRARGLRDQNLLSLKFDLAANIAGSALFI